MAPNAQEALIFFLPIVIVLGAFGLAIFGMTKHTRKLNKERYLNGKQIGAMCATNIGVEKAYKIADELPDCPYRDGYVEGVASVEEAIQRNI